MFDPAKELHNNPALFACYILFVYFRGRNAVRIEREMRGLGYHTFHRRPRLSHHLIHITFHLSLITFSVFRS